MLLPTELGKAMVFPEPPSTLKFCDLESHDISPKSGDIPSVSRMTEVRTPGNRLSGARANLKEGELRKEDKRLPRAWMVTGASTLKHRLGQVAPR